MIDIFIKKVTFFKNDDTITISNIKLGEYNIFPQKQIK